MLRGCTGPPANPMTSTGAAAGGRAAGAQQQPSRVHAPLPGLPHFPPKAKSLIYLHMNGGPAQMDLWDYKPQLQRYFNQPLPESVRQGQRLTTMTSGQGRFPVAPSKFRFARHGSCGTWVSELLPWTAKIVDDLAVIKSVHTEAINHDPAVTYICTGHQIPGRPSTQCTARSTSACSRSG